MKGLNKNHKYKDKNKKYPFSSNISFPDNFILIINNNYLQF